MVWKYCCLVLFMPVIVCVNSINFIFNCCRLMDSSHSYIFKVHSITTTSCSRFYKHTSWPHLPKPCFSIQVVKKWAQRKFHDLIAFLKKHLSLLITSIVVSNVSTIHMRLLLAILIRYNCDGFLLVFNSWDGDKFSLLIVY